MSGSSHEEQIALLRSKARSLSTSGSDIASERTGRTQKELQLQSKLERLQGSLKRLHASVDQSHGLLDETERLVGTLVAHSDSYVAEETSAQFDNRLTQVFGAYVINLLTASDQDMIDRIAQAKALLESYLPQADDAELDAVFNPVITTGEYDDDIDLDLDEIIDGDIHSI